MNDEPVHDQTDNDSPRDVHEAIDAELAFHIEALRNDVERSGITPDEAVAEVRRRFGDPDRFRNECRRIAMKEHIMKQRMQYAAMGIMLAMIIGLAIHALIARQQTMELRRAIEHERARTEAVSRHMMQMLTAGDAIQEARQVSVLEVLDEAVKRSYEWNLKDNPELESTLREAIEQTRNAIDENDGSQPEDTPLSDGAPAHANIG